MILKWIYKHSYATVRILFYKLEQETKVKSFIIIKTILSYNTFDFYIFQLFIINCIIKNNWLIINLFDLIIILFEM